MRIEIDYNSKEFQMKRTLFAFMSLSPGMVNNDHFAMFKKAACMYLLLQEYELKVTANRL